jgi:hypothetical protein
VARSGGTGGLHGELPLLRFNADGSVAGAQNLVRTLKLEPDAKSMTGTISAELLDPANHVIGPPICGVETGMRVG